MTTRDAIIEKLLKVHKAGELTTFSLPGASQIVMGCDRVMLSEALTAWDSMTRLSRERVIRSVRKAIKDGLRKLESGQLNGRDQDDFASDCALWFAYELRFGNASKYVVENVPGDAIRRAAH